MSGISDYTIVYDISDDTERLGVDRTLKDFGFRVQKSVFECRMDKKGKDELIKRLEALDLKTGFVKIYRLEYSFRGKVIGQKKDKGIDKGSAFII